MNLIEALKGKQKVTNDLLKYCISKGIKANEFFMDVPHKQVGTLIDFIETDYNILVLADLTAYIVRWASFADTQNTAVAYIKANKTPIIHETYLDYEEKHSITNFFKGLEKAFEYIENPF